MAKPVSRMSSTRQDYGTPGSGNGAEKATWGAFGVAVTAGNIVAQTAAIAALRLAVEGLTLGLEVAASIVAFDYIAAGIVTEPLAQRENKWLCRYHDNAGTKFRLELPCAKLSLLDTGTEFLDLAGTEAAAFKSAFEAYVVSPQDSSACVLDSMQFVGRQA